MKRKVKHTKLFLPFSKEVLRTKNKIWGWLPGKGIKKKTDLKQLKKNCGGISPRNGRRNRPPHWACATGSPATGAPGPGSQRNGDPCGYASDGRRLVGEVAQQRRRRLPWRAPRLWPWAPRRICGVPRQTDSHRIVFCGGATRLLSLLRLSGWIGSQGSRTRCGGEFFQSGSTANDGPRGGQATLRTRSR